MEVVSEVLDITDELITLLSYTDDAEFKRLRECTTIQQTLNKMYEDHENKIKEEIIALTSTYEEEKNKTNQLNHEEHTEELNKAKEERQQSVQHKQIVQSQFNELKSKLDECEEESEKIEEEKEQLLNSTTKVIPAYRHDVNLYNYITGIRWQYDCPADEVRGYVANKKQVKPFNLNTKQNSKYFIANYLWDLIENDWE